MVIDTDKLLPGVTFEELTRALDGDASFREAVLSHLGQASSGPAPTSSAGAGRNHVTLESKGHFTLDDHKVFDLNGAGLKLTVIAEN